MSPIREHMEAAQQRIQEMNEHIQHDRNRLKHYQQELDTIYPPAYVYNRKKPEEKFAYYSYWERVEDLKDHIDRTEDSITRWIYFRNKLLNRSLQLSCAA